MAERSLCFTSRNKETNMATTSSKHLIDLELIPLLDMLPPLNPSRESLPQIRAIFNELTAQGCMNDSAGKFCPDIMPPRAIASVQKETEDV